MFVYLCSVIRFLISTLRAPFYKVFTKRIAILVGILVSVSLEVIKVVVMSRMKLEPKILIFYSDNTCTRHHVRNGLVG